jgi:hypothetical protein
MSWKTSVAVSALVLAGWISTAPASAQLPIGDPIDFKKPTLVMQPGSYTLLPLRAVDPAGGPPWGMATYLAQPTDRRITVVCREYGRVVDGRLGAVTDTNVFRPYVPGGGLLADCGSIDSKHGERASGYSIRVASAVYSEQCMQAAAITTPACAPRTLIAASLGRGILSAAERVNGRWKLLPRTDDGTLLVVRSGVFTDATIPSIQIRATVCGPNARTDLRGWKIVKVGCTLTYEIPNGPRPAPESPASRRARHASRLDGRVRIIEKQGVAAVRRFVARFVVPITVHSLAEGYAPRLRGPGGPQCRTMREADIGDAYLTSYLQVAGRTYNLPLAPIEYKRGVWCRGRYILDVLYVRREGSETKPRFRHKIVATTTFTVR